jgi:hypothetical protein
MGIGKVKAGYKTSLRTLMISLFNKEVWFEISAVR